MLNSLSLADKCAIYACVARVIRCDGTVRPLERAFLQATRIRLGLEGAEATTIEAKVAVGMAEMTLPTDESARKMMLETVTQAAEIDGPMDAKEREVIRVLATRLGLAEEAPQSTLGEDVSRDVHSLLDALRSPSPVRSLWRLHTTALGLLAVNAWTLIAVLFFRWDIYFLVFTYWAENVVIGVFNVLKILWAQGDADWRNPVKTVAGKVVTSLVFLFWYFWFTGIHGLFVIGMFRLGMFERNRGIDFVQAFLGSFKPPVLAAIALMFLAHGHSFLKDYLGGGESARTKAGDLAFAPLARVLVMHISILFGGAVLVILKVPRLFCLVLIPLKTLLDLSGHSRERRHAGPR